MADKTPANHFGVAYTIPNAAHQPWDHARLSLSYGIGGLEYMFSGLGRVPWTAPVGAQKVLRILVHPAAVLAAGKRDFQNRRQVHHEEHIDFPSVARSALRRIC
jgi:hypothetical protein